MKHRQANHDLTYNHNHRRAEYPVVGDRVKVAPVADHGAFFGVVAAILTFDGEWIPEFK